MKKKTVRQMRYWSSERPRSPRRLQRRETKRRWSARVETKPPLSPRRERATRPKVAAFPIAVLSRKDSKYKTDNQGIKVQSILRRSWRESGFSRREERARTTTGAHLRFIDLVVESDVLRVDRFDLFDLGLVSLLHLDEVIKLGGGRLGLDGRDR